MAFSDAPPLCTKDITVDQVDQVDQERNVYFAFNCDVVVSLVRRSTSVSAPASTYQSYPTEDMMNATKRLRSSTYQSYPTEDMMNATKRLRLSNQEEMGEENLGDVHMTSSQLCRCSKYFDACLSERWAGAEIIPATTPVHLTLDVLTDVEYYRDCFSRMYSNKHKQIPNVDHCMKLIQVATQISYLELVEDCVCYLTSIPWSPIEEEGIRQFANSVFYPSDCAADLSARLGLALTNIEKHNLLLNMRERALCRSFDDFIDSGVYSCETSFFHGFRLIIAGPCHTLVENVLQHVNARVKKLILEAKEHPEDFCFDVGFGVVQYTLTFLVETGYAKGFIEYIVEESPVCQLLKRNRDHVVEYDWMHCIFVLFREVVKGRLLLKTSTRYRLIDEWTWILLLKNSDMIDEKEMYKILGTFVMTFPYETQEEIISNWVASYSNPSQDLCFMKIQRDWFASLEKEDRSVHLNHNDQPHMDMP